MASNHRSILMSLPLTGRIFLALLILLPLLPVGAHGAMLYKNYIVRYDRGWDILCDPYEIQPGDWVLKIFRQKGEIAHQDFREFLGIFQRLNPQVKDIDRLRPGEVVDIPLKKLAQGNLPGQSSGVVTIPFVMLDNPKETIKKNAKAYTVRRGDTVSQLIANQFGGRFGNLTYRQGLKLFKAVNPHIKDVNHIYAGQKIYMPDPSIRRQSWYDALFDEKGDLVEEMSETGAGAPPQTAPSPAAAQAPAPESAGPAAEAAGMVGGRLLSRGTYFLPMKQGKEFELDLSRFPMIDLQNGRKVILSTQDRVMNVDLPLVQSYWDDVDVVKIPENATAQEILEAVLAVLPDNPTANRLAFDDGGVSIALSAKWIRSEASGDGSVPRHTCITPITAAGQQTNGAIVRYLERNDIIIKEILNGAPLPMPPLPPQPTPATTVRIDGSSQKSLVESFSHLMEFRYSPNTAISFPYAGIQVNALSNLLSFGNGREILVDFGDLYGDAIKAIRETGLNVVQINAGAGPLAVIAQLMNSAGMSYTTTPVFYGADRPATFNTAITVEGILLPTPSGEKLLFTVAPIPDLIDRFIRDQGIRRIRIAGSESAADAAKS